MPTPEPPVRSSVPDANTEDGDGLHQLLTQRDTGAQPRPLQQEGDNQCEGMGPLHTHLPLRSSHRRVETWKPCQ